MSSADPYNLQRFVDAQKTIFEQVCCELRGVRKRSHWIWFIFPQIRGPGRSPTADYFALSSAQEAQAYLSHPVLGARLRTCTALANDVQNSSIEQIFGYPDHLKFRSCMTLFANVTADNAVFHDALEKYFASEPDPLTLERL